MISPEHFNALDWLIVVVVFLSMCVSLVRGFSRELLSLLGWVAAFVLANLFATQVAGLLAGFIANITGRYIVAWACTFVAVLLLSGLLARLFGKLVKASGLGLLDRLLGTVFGALRGLLLIMVLAYVVESLVPPAEQQILYESQLMPFVDQLLDWSLRAFDDLRAGRMPSVTA